MGSPESDLAQLDTHLDDAGYILIHPDDPYSKWLVVSYVPDTSPVKDKVSVFGYVMVVTTQQKK